MTYHPFFLLKIYFDDMLSLKINDMSYVAQNSATIIVAGK
jgi:hypothetical protein